MGRQFAAACRDRSPSRLAPQRYGTPAPADRLSGDQLEHPSARRSRRPTGTATSSSAHRPRIPPRHHPGRTTPNSPGDRPPPRRTRAPHDAGRRLSPPGHAPSVAPANGRRRCASPFTRSRPARSPGMRSTDSRAGGRLRQHEHDAGHGADGDDRAGRRGVALPHRHRPASSAQLRGSDR